MEAYIGEIRMVGFSYAPQGWAFCNGQIIAISENEALFALLGTYYGGDGRNNFGLPDLRGRVPIHTGTASSGPGLSSYRIGQQGGAESTTLTNANMPPANLGGNNIYNGPGDQLLIDGQTQSLAISGVDDGRTTSFAGKSFSTKPPNAKIPHIGTGGGGQAISNIPPFLGINFIICLYGNFPPRS